MRWDTQPGVFGQRVRKPLRRNRLCFLAEPRVGKWLKRLDSEWDVEEVREVEEVRIRMAWGTPGLPEWNGLEAIGRGKRG